MPLSTPRLTAWTMPPAGRPSGMRVEEREVDPTQLWEQRETPRAWGTEPPSVGGLLSPPRKHTRLVRAVPYAPAAPPVAPREENYAGSAPRDELEHSFHPRKTDIIGGNRAFRSRAGLLNESRRPVETSEYGQQYVSL